MFGTAILFFIMGLFASVWPLGLIASTFLWLHGAVSGIQQWGQFFAERPFAAIRVLGVGASYFIIQNTAIMFAANALRRLVTGHWL